MSDVTTDSGQLEKPDSLGDKPEDVVRRWVMWLDMARGDHAKKWRERGHKVVKRYKDERDTDSTRRRVRFNILYSNTEILKPELYSRTPTPDVRRRFLDEDRVARVAADILQRTISYHTDALDFDGVMSAARDDYLLPGMGCVRVRYVPHYEPAKRRIYVRPIDPALPTEAGPKAMPAPAEISDAADTAGLPEAPPDAPPTHVRMDTSEPVPGGTAIRNEGGSSFIDGEEYSRVAWEEMVPEYQPWDDWCWSPAKQWCHVDAVAYRGLLTRQQCVTEFGEDVGNKIPLNWTTQGERKDLNKDDDPKSLFRRAEVWEIWDRDKRQVLAICRDFPEAPCKVIDDPLGLRDFFPQPEPVVAIRTTDEYLPVPPFTLYQDQATELDNLTDRIDKLVGALKWRMLYDANATELSSLMTKGDNAMVPVRDAMAFREKGGIANAIWIMPLADLASVIDKLVIQREQVKATIWELTGISDLMRGAGDPSETATAQNIKGRYGKQRISSQQKAIARFARDIFRLMGEGIATKFQWETLSMMSGITLPSDADVAMAKQALQMVMAQAQQPPPMAPGAPPGAPPQPGAPPAPHPPAQEIEALKEAANSVTREQVMALFRSAGPRGFRVDIETDSTVAPNASEEQQNRIQLVTAVATFMEHYGPAVESGMMSKELGRELLLFVVRSFTVGAQLEDALETLGTTPSDAPPKPDPEMVKAQATVAAENARAQADIAVEQVKADTAKSIAEFKAQLDAHGLQMKAYMDQQQHQQDMQAQRDKHATEMLHDREEHQQDMAHAAQAAAAAAAAPTVVVAQ